MFYITVKDRYMRKLGIISNDIPRALHFRDDKQHDFLAEGAETFEITIEKYMNGLLQENTGMLVYGNILSFYDENDKVHVYMIQHPIETRRNIKLQCTSLNLELINEQTDKYASSVPLTFFQYLNNMEILVNSSMQLNINEVKNSSLALTFDTQETKLARLLNLVSAFNAECEMLPKLTTEGLMDHIELNVYIANDGGTHSGVGQYRNDVLITIGKDVQDITRDIDGTNVFNAAYVTGQNSETIKNTSISILNENGEEEFYIRPGSPFAFAPLSKIKYPSTSNPSNIDGWTRRNFQIQSTSESDLAAYAIKMLRTYAYPLVTYSIASSTGLNWDRYNLNIGDTIKISDMKFDDQGLVLSARVTEKITSRENPSANSIVFSNFVRRKVQTSVNLQNMIDQKIPYNTDILTDNGTVLKKAGDYSNLSVYMSKGQDLDVEITPDSYSWTINGKQVSTDSTLHVSYENLTKDVNLISVQTTIKGVIVGSANITISSLVDGISPINLVIKSSNGYQFKNNVINTTFTALLYQNNKEIDVDGTKYAYVWSKNNYDGTADTTWNNDHQYSSKTITITNKDVWQRATFNCSAEPLN